MVHDIKFEVGTALVLPQDVDNGEDLTMQLQMRYGDNFQCALYSGNQKIAEETFTIQELESLANKLYLTYDAKRVRKALCIT